LSTTRAIRQGPLTDGKEAQLEVFACEHQLCSIPVHTPTIQGSAPTRKPPRAPGKGPNTACCSRRRGDTGTTPESCPRGLDFAPLRALHSVDETTLSRQHICRHNFLRDDGDVFQGRQSETLALQSRTRLSISRIAPTSPKIGVSRRPLTASTHHQCRRIGACALTICRSSLITSKDHIVTAGFVLRIAPENGFRLPVRTTSPQGRTTHLRRLREPCFDKSGAGILPSMVSNRAGYPWQ